VISNSTALTDSRNIQGIRFPVSAWRDLTFLEAYRASFSSFLSPSPLPRPKLRRLRCWPRCRWVEHLHSSLCLPPSICAHGRSPVDIDGPLPFSLSPLGGERRWTTPSSGGVALPYGAAAQWRALQQRGGEHWWCALVLGVDVPRRWHPWLRRRSGMWLNGGLWRFTVEAGGCVGNRSRRWPWSALPRLAGGRRGRLTWCPCQDVKMPFMESHGLRCRGLVVPRCQVSAAQGAVGIRIEHHGGALGPCRGRTSNNSSRPWRGQREDLSHPICQPMSSLSLTSPNFWKGKIFNLI
jgi:hypothetical protein